MSISSMIPRAPCEIHHWCKLPTFRHDRSLLALVLAEPKCVVVYRCPLRWGVKTGKNVARSQKALFRCLRRARGVATVFPERRAERVGNLTNFVLKTHAYPAAYGGFSDVWRCQLQCTQSPPEMVAVKAIRPVTREEYQAKSEAFGREFKIWGSLEHQNVLPLYGITYGFGQFPAFVCPWAENGTLSEYLEKCEAQLDMRKRMALLGGVAAGLQYSHGDLSGANVLITGDGRAHLSDFGLSTLINQAPDMPVSGPLFPGNIRWAAPELFSKGREGGSSLQLSGRLADIYSFGSVMLQTLTGKLPFHRVQEVAQIVIMVFRGDNPPREPGWDGEAIPGILWKFIETCWANPSDRPCSEKIVAFINDQMSRL